jgi:hypothetical protein
MISGFGNRLRQQRESCGATIEEISEATNIDASYFEALERGDLQKLPGPAYGKFYIRVYGEYLGFDPDPLIADYDLDLAALDQDVAVEEEPAPEHEWKEALRKTREAAAARRKEAVEPEPEPEPEPEEPEEVEAEEPALIMPAEPEPREQRPQYPRPLWKGIAAAFVATTFLSIIIWSFMYCTEGRSPLDNRQEPDVEIAVAEQQQPATDMAETVEEPPPTPTPEPEPGKLTVTEFGLGRRIVNYRLEGIDDRFTEGEVVWFLTRVRGGEPGDSIRHYWFNESGRVQVVDLELGSPHYRTRSKKTLWGVGEWVVEARDSEGRVLARSEFDCVPR